MNYDNIESPNTDVWTDHSPAQQADITRFRVSRECLVLASSDMNRPRGQVRFQKYSGRERRWIGANSDR
jgi:hypothetical protein